MGEYLDVPGARLYYEVEGEGPPLTLVHAGVAHLGMWDEQVAAWRDRWRVIRYDTRGFGRTLSEDVPYSNRDDLRRLMDHLGVERTHLLGLSRGAIIALDFTVEQPDRVSALIWVAGGIRGFETPEDPREEALWPELERLEAARDWEPLVELETRLWGDGPGQPAGRLEAGARVRLAEWNLENYRADQPANQAIQPDVPAAELLERIAVPVLAVWGTLDVQPAAASGEHLAASVPNGRSHMFEGVAHMVNLERPREFNQLVADFLAEVEHRA